MPAPKIVARNFSDAHAFARNVLGLPVGRYRVVTSPSALFGSHGEVYLVPGWDKRPDRFAIKGKLRYTRLTVIDGADTIEKSKENPAEVPETSNGDNMISEGAPVTILTEVTDNFTPVAESTAETIETFAQAIADSVTEAVADDIAATAERLDEALQALATPSEDNVSDFPAPEEAPADEDNDVEGDDSDSDVDEPPLNGRRRRRCKDCGLLIHPDLVEDHARDHAADSVSLEKHAEDNAR